MDATIIASGITQMLAIGVAATTVFLTYSTTKRREHLAEWRKLKFDVYRSYVAALSSAAQGNAPADAQQKLCDATNILTLVAPPTVIASLHAFIHSTTSDSEGGENRAYQDSLGKLMNSIREDIRPAGENLGRSELIRFVEPARRH